MTNAPVDYKAQAREFAEWLLHLQGKGRRRRFNDAIVRGTCPRPEHDDKNPSFSFNCEMDAYACSCSSGKGSELRAALGWKPSNGGVSYSRPAPSFATAAPPNRPPDDVYRYANRNEKLKWRMPGQKSVIQWRHAGNKGMQGDPGIYRLEEAIPAARNLAVIHVSESESDADALAELGLVAIATPHGAASPWKLEAFPPQLAGARLVVWEHQDEPGRKYAAAVADVARKANCDAAIARPKEGFKDVRDWILAGADKEQLESRANEFLFDFPRAEPANDLLAADLAPPDYVIQPAAIRGNLTMVQGEPKAGKSMITLYMAVCAALGIWPAGRWIVPRPVRVLYMTWEDPRRRIQKRLKQFLAGLGEPFKPITAIPNLFFYSKSKGPFKSPRIRLEEPAGRTLLRKLILAHRAELVFLDTLSHLTGVDENAKKEMQPVMDALTDIVEETDCSLSFTHHTGKLGKEGGRSSIYRSRGSSTIPAAPDVILHFGNRGKTHATPCGLTSREDESDEFLIEYLADGKEIIRFKLVDPESEEEGEDGTYAIRKSIIENLSTICSHNPEGASRGQVAKACKQAYNTVKRHLDQMADDNLIQRRQVETPKGLEWRYAPITHVWPGAK